MTHQSSHQIQALTTVQRRDLQNTGKASIKGDPSTAERGQVVAPADLRRAREPRENAGVSQRRLIRVAPLNNAEWCDAFCRTHGIVGHFRAGYWFSPLRLRWLPGRCSCGGFKSIGELVVWLNADFFAW